MIVNGTVGHKAIHFLVQPFQNSFRLTRFLRGRQSVLDIPAINDHLSKFAADIRARCE